MKIKVGYECKVIANVSGHSIPIGTKSVIDRPGNNPNTWMLMGYNSWVNENDIKILPQSKKFLKKELSGLQYKKSIIEEKLDFLKSSNLSALNINDFQCHLLSKIVSSDEETKEKVKKIFNFFSERGVSGPGGFKIGDPCKVVGNNSHRGDAEIGKKVILKMPVNNQSGWNVEGSNVWFHINDLELWEDTPEILINELNLLEKEIALWELKLNYLESQQKDKLDESEFQQFQIHQTLSSEENINNKLKSIYNILNLELPQPSKGEVKEQKAKKFKDDLPSEEEESYLDNLEKEEMEIEDDFTS